MKYFSTPFLCLCLCSNLFAQVDPQPGNQDSQQKHSVNVNQEVQAQVPALDTVVKVKLNPAQASRHYKEKVPVILTIEYLKSDLYNTENIVNVTIDEEASTFSNKEYEVTKTIKDKKVTDNDGNHEMMVIFSPNTNHETARKKLVLNVTVKTPNKKQYSKQLVLTVTAENDSISNYRYLAYIGTNFDLVDGIKAKNLFFATNIFVPPSNIERTGFYFSLYGNRTSTFRDSIRNYRNEELRAIRTDASDNRYAVYETADLKLEGYSDNLGIYIAPLIRLWKQKESFKFYYSPSTEFVWRRNVQNSTWYNLRESQPDYDALVLGEYESNIEFPLQYRASVANNIYDWNLGIIGFFLNHESDRMSIRLNINTGPSWRYSTSITDRGSYLSRGGGIIEPFYEEDTDLFFSGKLWITERYSGITLEAEVANYMDHTSPFYGVTLSKAIDFGKLATIFEPISR